MFTEIKFSTNNESVTKNTFLFGMGPFPKWSTQIHTQPFGISPTSQGLSGAKLRIWFHLKSQRYLKPVRNSKPWWARCIEVCLRGRIYPGEKGSHRTDRQIESLVWLGERTRARHGGGGLFVSERPLWIILVYS